jgi:glucose-6-phosphate 1-dehydrogenase
MVIAMADTQCQSKKPIDPCGIIIFGASGDLTFRKIMPALYKLFCNDSLPGSFFVLGCGRTGLATEAFRQKMHDAICTKGECDLVRWKDFAHKLYYATLDYNDKASYSSMAQTLSELDRYYATGKNRLLYLAIPPFLFETVISKIGEAGLAGEDGCTEHWTRLVVEKPFGSDLKSAAALNEVLGRYFKEHQIYRIDHYLAKETVQNILIFRFANSILEPVWNRDFIASVDICAAETLGVEHRAGYYERAGVLRDMFQNHILQLLSLVAMEPPAQFLPEMVRDEKAKVFQSLRPFTPARLAEDIVLGQYGSGIVEGKSVPAYRNELGVDPASLTPTYAMMKVFIDNWRWQGVPFYLMSGKRLAEKLSRIIIQFKDVPHSIFRNIISTSITANRLTFIIQPDEKISLTFQAKNPGTAVCLRPITMEFIYAGDKGKKFDAYEKVLLDCLNGDQMLALRQDSEELSWSFLTPLIEDCERCIKTDKILEFYEAATWGPPAAEKVRPPHGEH